MPDLVACLLAVLTAAGTTAAAVLVLGRPGRSARTARIKATEIVGTALGLAAGYVVLRFQPGWPPATGMDRFLLIVLPAVIGTELLATVPGVPRALVMLLRIGLAMSAARILLHGSVYLRGVANDPAWRTWILLALAGVLLATEWGLLVRLSRRAGGLAVPMALAASLLCGGLAVMLAGYLAGGEAALPPAAALMGAALASAAVGRQTEPGALGIAVVALFGLLFLGRFFGALPTEQGLTVFLAPLACWAAEHRALASQTAWRKRLFGLGLVAIPLVVVLVLAKRHFDRGLAPLLSQVHDVRTRLTLLN